MQADHVPTELAEAIRLTILDKLIGQKIYYSDTMADLVKRHCPQVFEMAEARGFQFVPNGEKEPLMKMPPDLRWEIVKRADTLH